ncbi:MAG: hypothetical protein AAFP13_04055 [Pseudomonadota bacterium]
MSSKISRLSPTDLVNNAALPTTKKWSHLESLETPKVFWGYQPVHAAFPKILAVSSGLFGVLRPDTDEAILSGIRRACHRDEQETANIAVAQAIMEWRDQTGARAVIANPEPFRSTTGTIKFCADVAVIVGGELFVVNLDVRSTMNLTNGGKQMMKSLIHHTALLGDLRSAKVAILKTPRVSAGLRKCEIEELVGSPAYSLDEVERAVLETYSIWELILMRRRAEAAKKASGDDGSLL